MHVTQAPHQGYGPMVPPGQEGFHPGTAGQNFSSTTPFNDPNLAGVYNVPPEPDTVDIDHPLSDASVSGSDEHYSSDEGEISSDTQEKPE